MPKSTISIFSKRLGLVAGLVTLVGISAAIALGAVRETRYWLEVNQDDSCVGCHAPLHPGMVQQWKSSAHFSAGVGCEACHGEDHDAIFAADGDVSAQTCAGMCHSVELAEFSRSKHSQPKTGKKADLLPKYVTTTGGCSFSAGCHSVRKEYPDGSRGKCRVCHPSHSFSMETTRDPSTCVTCHSGTNNTEVEEYAKSMHGILHRTAGPDGGGPTCVTCHMPAGSHDDGANVTDLVKEDMTKRRGGAPLRFVRTMPRDEFEGRREKMLKVCDECHGRKLAKKALLDGDAFRRHGAEMLDEASHIVHALYDERVLEPMPEERPANPTVESGLALGASQLFDIEMSAAERIFYNMYMFTYSAAWRRGYHNLPSLIRWHENEMLKDDLIMLRSEASRLRASAAHRRGAEPPGAGPAAAPPPAAPPPGAEAKPGG